MATATTCWIKTGGDVLVYCKSSDGRTTPSPRRTTITRVAGKSFTVDGIDERINLETQESKQIGGSWTGWVYRVVPPDSDEAHCVLDKHRRLETAYRARVAVDNWKAQRTRKNRLAAIKALEAIDDDA